jgi:hypothetical protein
VSWGSAILLLIGLSLAGFVITQQLRRRQQNPYVFARSVQLVAVVLIVVVIWLVRRAT